MRKNNAGQTFNIGQVHCQGLFSWRGEKRCHAALPDLPCWKQRSYSKALAAYVKWPVQGVVVYPQSRLTSRHNAWSSPCPSFRTIPSGLPATRLLEPPRELSWQAPLSALFPSPARANRSPPASGNGDPFGVRRRALPNPSIMTGDVGGRLAVPFSRAVGPRVGQALPLHRAGAARLGGAAHGRAPARHSPGYRRIGELGSVLISV